MIARSRALGSVRPAKPCAYASLRRRRSRRWLRLLGAVTTVVVCTLGLAPPAAAQLPEQYWFTTLSLSKAWAVSKGAGVTVAVVDSGVNATLGDLGGQVLPGVNLSGSSAPDGRSDPGSGCDQSGGCLSHGTNMALAIAGTGEGSRLHRRRATGEDPAGQDLDPGRRRLQPGHGRERHSLGRRPRRGHRERVAGRLRRLRPGRGRGGQVRLPARRAGRRVHRQRRPGGRLPGQLPGRCRGRWHRLALSSVAPDQLRAADRFRRARRTTCRRSRTPLRRSPAAAGRARQRRSCRRRSR